MWPVFLLHEHRIGNRAHDLGSSHIKEIFAEVFTDVDKLVDEQIDSARAKGLSITVSIFHNNLLTCRMRTELYPGYYSGWRLRCKPISL
jgi:hypothetical protein